MSPSAPPPKRARKSRQAYKPPRDRKELMTAIGAGFAVVVLSLGAVLFLGRDHLGSNSTTPVTTVTTIPAGGSTTPTSATPGTTPPLSTPPDSSAPAGSETVTPTDSSSTSTTLPGAPTP